MHCTHCGVEFTQEAWPRTCAGCGKTSYKNPLPVVVTLVPVEDGKKTGLLVIRRNIAGEESQGKLALPGGYIDFNDESWQHAAAREVLEETGIRLKPSGFTEFAVRSAPDKTLLIFVQSKPIKARQLPKFSATSETSELAVIPGPKKLAFPIHTEVAKRFFQQVSEKPVKHEGTKARRRKKS
jgi:8-oxo-dGTP pyrophosphatase MutT (NUDIX family)